MTHCGANSLFEAMYFGKLIIGIPQEIDQYANAYKAQLMGIGKSFTKHELQKGIDSFSDDILEVLSNKSYIYNVRRFQTMMEFEEVRGQKDFKYWIDLTVKYKYSHLLTSHNIENPLFVKFNKIKPVQQTFGSSYLPRYIT